MNVKGGIAYIDFNNRSFSTSGTLTISGIYKNANDAFKSSKMICINNITRSGVNDDKTPYTVPVINTFKVTTTGAIILFVALNASIIRLTIGSNDSVSFS